MFLVSWDPGRTSSDILNQLEDLGSWNPPNNPFAKRAVVADAPMDVAPEVVLGCDALRWRAYCDRDSLRWFVVNELMQETLWADVALARGIISGAGARPPLRTAATAGRLQRQPADAAEGSPPRSHSRGRGDEPVVA